MNCIQGLITSRLTHLGAAFKRGLSSAGICAVSAAALLGASSAWSQAVITQVRTSSFSYFSNGLLQSETVEPDSPNLCVVTTHSYDACGNKSGASTANCPGASGLALFDTRASSATFAAQTAALTINGATVNAAIPAGTFATSSRVALTANIADAGSHTESREFDPRFGQVTKLIGPNGATLATTWQLDEFGRKVLEARADGTRGKAVFCLISGRVSDITSNSPECAGLLFAPNEVPATAVRFEHSEPQDSAGIKAGPYARVYFDAAGRKLRTATQAFDGPNQPAGPGGVIVQDAQYNAHGGVVVATQPYFLATGSATTGSSQDMGLSRTDYDALGRSTVVYTADPATAQQTGGSIPSVAFGSWGSRRASQTTITYNGLQSTTTDDKGRSRSEEKNPDGKVVRTTDAFGAQLVHQHDALGNLIATKDPLGNTIVVTYDVRGRKVRMQDPDAGNTDYCYDALGQLKAQQTSNMRGGHGTTTCPGVSGAGSTAVAVAGWTTLAYDRLGRLTSRMEPEYTTTWYHDKDASGKTCGRSLGKTCQSVTSHGVSRKSFYDTLGRPVASRTDVTGGPRMASAVSYDAKGRLATQTYPTGLQVRYSYTAGLGFLNRISNVTALTGAAPLAANTVLWEGKSYNAWGRAEKQTYSAGVLESRTAVEPQTGRLQSLTAGPGSSNSVVHQRLHWNSVGELTARVDGLGDGSSGIEISDTYSYDVIGRLTKYVVAGNGTPSARTVDLQYNALGMLLYKTDVGVYAYPAQGVVNGRPHALQSVAGSLLNSTYGYDNNGNVVSATGGKYRSIAYTSFNLPDSNLGLQGPAGSPKYTWQYDENHARIKETRVNAAGTRVTWYLHPDNKGGLAFERDEPAGGGAAQNRHYVGGFAMLVTEGALPVLTVTQQAPVLVSAMAAVKVEYWHKDHLGSLIATTNAAGLVTARYSYDPFGKRRQVNGTYDAFGTLVVDFGPGAAAGTDRGYTGHEHLDDVGVIHMNGRVFDPVLGRFMQADPFVQEPDNLQNYDRFMYCFANPGTCTDPTGYLSFKSVFKIVAIAVISYFTAGAATAWAAAALSGGAITTAATFASLSITNAMIMGAVGGATAGFVGGAIMTGSITGAFKGAAQGAFTGALFGAVGSLVGDAGLVNGNVEDYGEFAKGVAAHGVAGCVASVAGGAKCGPGALSAAFSKAALPFTNGMGDGPVRTVAHAVIGGTASSLGGGKFSNGAVTGAFGYLFNKALHAARAGAAGAAGGTAMQSTGDPDLDRARGLISLGTSSDLDRQVIGAYGPFHRLDSALNVGLVVASGEVWGTNPRNSVFSDIPSVKAHGGPLPSGVVGVEFYTDVAPTNGHPTMPRWTLSPGVTPAPLPGYLRIDVKVTNFRLTPEPK